jgi:Bacterial membrane protein YfhO
VRIEDKDERPAGILGPCLLLLALTALLTWQVFDPQVQLFDRDTGRFTYPLKQYISASLRAGRLPLWFPWTQSGMSLMGEMAPGLFHPFTLLYLALPFELAFKLNHLLAIPLAAAGTFLLARKLGAAQWPAALAGAVYAGSGFVVSMSDSNLYLVLGVASVPLALHGLLRFLETPRPLRLLWAGFALALPMLAGEAQSALFAGLAGVLATVALHGFRKLRLTLLWAAAALMLCAPALLPGLLHLRRSLRGAGVQSVERESFALSPVRLLGLALPWAFDDSPERNDPAPAYDEYFAGPAGNNYATSIALSIPALLLAGFARGRKALALFVLALVFALGSLGGGFELALHYLLPGQALFRYAEKLVAPLSLCTALLAGLGADRAFKTPRAAGWLAFASLIGGALIFLARNLVQRDAFLRFLQAHGEAHSVPASQSFAVALSASLLVQGCLMLALCAVAAGRWWKPIPQAQLLAAAVCAGAAVLASRDLFFVAPLELLHGPFPLAEQLFARAGESRGNWRIDPDLKRPSPLPSQTRKTRQALFGSRSLSPQFNALARVESTAAYASLVDADYLDAWDAAPLTMNQLFGVRFSLRSPWEYVAAEARADGFVRGVQGFWIREEPPQPRTFLVACAHEWQRDQALQRLPGMDPHLEALGLELPRCVRPGGAVQLERPSPEKMIAHVQATDDSLLVFAEHFDPGWRATVDGASAPAVQVDLAAVGVRMGPGTHEVRLSFWPAGLTAGLCCCFAALAGLLVLGLRERRAVPTVKA